MSECDHEKIYSGERFLTLVPQWAWICTKCRHGLNPRGGTAAARLRSVRVPAGGGRCCGSRKYAALGQKDEATVMFDFRDETGSGKRFAEREKQHRETDLPVIRHRAWWLLHNLVAHPLIGVAPVRWAFEFHDWTSRKMSGEEK